MLAPTRRSRVWHGLGGREQETDPAAGGRLWALSSPCDRRLWRRLTAAACRVGARPRPPGGRLPPCPPPSAKAADGSSSTYGIRPPGALGPSTFSHCVIGPTCQGADSGGASGRAGVFCVGKGGAVGGFCRRRGTRSRTRQPGLMLTLRPMHDRILAMRQRQQRADTRPPVARTGLPAADCHRASAVQRSIWPAGRFPGTLPAP
jgi:hypothetical protein